MNILLLFGITLLLTVLSSFLFVRFSLPQVIGHIIIGILLGVSGIKLFDAASISNLVMLTYFALALVGFTIGGELRWARIKRFGASILIITFCESGLSALVVTVAIYLLTQNVPLSLLLGALAAATAPGGTTNVIQEYKARGQLTSTLYGVVGADDALAIIIFAIFSGIAKVMLGASESVHILGVIWHIVFDVGGAIVLGIVLGAIISVWMLFIRSQELRNLITLISIFMCAGLAIAMNVSLILASLVMGIVVSNIRPHRSRSYFLSLQYISTPIYMLFFVLIGARLDIHLLFTMGSVGVVYFVFRLFGKYFGAFTGAYLANASPKVRQNIGFCLFSQAGVAMGLAISMEIEFAQYSIEAQQLGGSIVTIITASTLIFQIIGPIMTKYALERAKETHV